MYNTEVLSLCLNNCVFINSILLRDYVGSLPSFPNLRHLLISNEIILWLKNNLKEKRQLVEYFWTNEVCHCYVEVCSVIVYLVVCFTIHWFKWSLPLLCSCLFGNGVLSSLFYYSLIDTNEVCHCYVVVCSVIVYLVVCFTVYWLIQMKFDTVCSIIVYLVVCFTIDWLIQMMFVTVM
jgi:hypothetical protein